MKKALVTGITGQDGSYLSEFLLGKGYEVHGIVRRVALESPETRLTRINHLLDKIKLHPATLESYPTLIDIVESIQPDECYHLAAQSFVHISFVDSFSTMNSNINGTHYILAAIHKKAPKCRFYFAGSSELFGLVEETPQTEKTKFHPRSPYGISKLTGFEITRNYREAYGLYACSGLLFNHESPRRGYEFVTRKITQTIARIKAGKANTLVLGNLDAKRDWGFAGDYVKAMWLMLQQESPKDYVIATGETHTVKEFVDLSFEYAGLSYILVDLHELSDEDADEKIRELKNKKDEVFVIQHPMFYRPAEIDLLLGDSTKAMKELGWKPNVQFEELVKMMVDYDIKDFKKNNLER